MTVTAAETRVFLQRRDDERRAHVEARTARLRALLPTAAERLRGEFGATEVWAFGSLTTGRAHAQSDVDLAVRGVGAGDYFVALAALADLFGADVDLVALETALPSLVARVLREGVPL
jgi:predicted nucleotidyltransferase